MNIAVIGLGKLGAPMAAVYASKGHEVVGCDLDEQKVKKLAAGQAPVEETGLQRLLDSRDLGIKAMTDIREGAAGAEIVFVIVPTPSLADGSFSLEYVRNVMFALADLHLRASMPYQLIAIVSTVSPLSMVQLREQFEAASGRTCGPQWGLVYNPEFIALGSVIHDLLHPNFVLVGQCDDRAGDLIEKFHLTIHDAPICRMSMLSAEVAKLGLNVALIDRISYANTVAELCEKMPGASAADVLKAVGLDPRIGHRYLSSGTAYGGPCFPRDCRAFLRAAQAAGTQAWQAEAVEAVNLAQTGRLADIVEAEIGDGDRIGILGLTYKTHTDVTEESAGLALVAELERRGHSVLTYDPRAPCTESSLACIVDTCGVLVVTTPWAEFSQKLPGLLARAMTMTTLIDCWGAFAPNELPDTVKHIVLGESL